MEQFPTSAPEYVGVIVTVFPVPALALSKAPVYVPEKVSPLIKPVYNTAPVFNVATSLPSQVLSEAVIPDTVKALL